MDDPAVDRGAQLIVRNRELLAKATETRAWTREVIVRAQHTVRATTRLQIARERSRRQWIDQELRNLP
jgi:hypothetical protein